MPTRLARLRPTRIRMRLTLLYGALFVVSGAVLLAITYLLVSNYPKASSVHKYTVDAGGGHPDGQLSGSPGDPGEQLPVQAARQHQAELHHLLVQSGVALAIMALISIALGWLVAGRILRPLRTMTTTIQQISARNVHDRLAAQGPRDEMKELSDTVDGLLERLATALEAHKRFVANAAHELRTPLTLEHALIEEALIDRGATVQSFRSTFERLLVIRKQHARLLDSLLTLTDSERGLDRREPVDLARVTEHVLLAHSAELDSRELRLHADLAPARTSGDPTLVERLVANLVDNAIGYNVPGGRVTVRTGADAGRAVVQVTNTGTPVPAEQVDRLFEPFQRLGRTAGRGGHHGLGLSIVRAIAAAHGASVSARACPHGGLAVRVAFPVAAPDPAPAPTDENSRRTLVR